MYILNRTSGGALKALDYLYEKNKPIQFGQQNFFKSKLEGIFLRLWRLINKKNSNTNVHSTGLLSSLKLSKLEPSIIDLHWIGAADISLEKLLKSEKHSFRVFLHDQWWFQGVCRNVCISCNSRFCKRIKKQKIDFLNSVHVDSIYYLNPLQLSSLSSLGLSQKSKLLLYHVEPLSLKKIVKRFDIIFVANNYNTDSNKNFEGFLSVLPKLNFLPSVCVVGDNLNPFQKQFLSRYSDYYESYSYLPSGAVRKLMSESKCLLSMSKSESYSLVVHEAVLSGCEAISSDVGNVTEMKKKLKGIQVFNNDYQLVMMLNNLHSAEFENNYWKNMINQNAALGHDYERLL